jgi:ferrous iron transport protein A
MQISQLQVGSRARITGFLPGDKIYRSKLVAMGLLPGTDFTLSRIAPLGDPVEIIIRGCAVSLRKEEARILQVEVV